MRLRLATILLVIVLVAALVPAATGATPRSETKRYLLGLGTGDVHVNVGQETYYLGAMRFHLNGDERFVSIKVRETHGLPVAAAYVVSRDLEPNFVSGNFCGQITFNLPQVGANVIEVTILDPDMAQQLFVNCRPGLGTTGTVRLDLW